MILKLRRFWKKSIVVLEEAVEMALG